MIEILEHNGEKYNALTGELINEVEQVEVEIIEDNLPDIVCNGGTHIKTNTEQLKRELSSYLEKYDVEVTADTEKDCSKMATELNKLSKDLDDKRKSTAAIIKKPADDLKIAVDELIAIVQNKRTVILEGVNIFKQRRFDLIRSLLTAKINELYIENNVSERYQVCNIEPLVVEGSLSKVSLSKNAIDSLDLMVRKVKAIEDKVEIRTLQLELKCSIAGLITPIEFDEVKNIIEDDDYEIKLERMISKHLEIEERTKKLIEMQEQQKQELLRKEEIKKAAIEEQKQLEEKNKVVEKQKETGKKIVRVNAVFEVEVNTALDNKKVIEGFRKKLNEHFDSLLSVEEINQF